MKITQHLLERKFFYLAITWTAIVAYLCLISISSKSVALLEVPFKDKIVHFIFYFLLYFFWIKALKKNKIVTQFKIVLILILYGIIIEVLQEIFTSDRQGDFFDVLANSLGALTSFVFLRFVNK
ncbi:conserved membrane hypothetical protein [Flavobacterium sp. 9AF]|uniref:VanZ family protein n=1 Tax=Flavobacterium sp. 9AF TaxID=2653142 RepID=UPI0012EF532D|nr:conserved membrane hypothetical protein [Flavobacterium sp. 9AF]